MATPVIPISRDQKDEEVPAQIYLQPIAAPSILGLYGFAGATFMVAAHIAHWYGTATTDFYLVPFAALFGVCSSIQRGNVGLQGPRRSCNSNARNVGFVLDWLGIVAAWTDHRQIGRAAWSSSGVRVLVRGPGSHHLDGNVGSGCGKQGYRVGSGIPCRRFHCLRGRAVHRINRHRNLRGLSVHHLRDTCMVCGQRAEA